MSDKNIGFFKRSVLKIITKLQVFALKRGNDRLYFNLLKIHFGLYFRKDIMTEYIERSSDYKRALKRHSAMISEVVFNSKGRDHYNDVVYMVGKNFGNRLEQFFWN